jgi:CheY-like chemotaxis protein
VEVRAARSVADALRLARAARPILILSDLHMPVQDGIALLKAAKSDAALRAIPFLLISASAPDAEEQQRATAAGADAMLLRPIDPEALLEHLKHFLPVEPEA